MAELAAARPHGDRLRYLAGCKCAECRAANSQYECQRAQARKNGDWNGIVLADEARAHLRKLSRAGLGRHTIAEASGIAASIIQAIRGGTKRNIRARTARRLLSVTADAIADRGLVKADGLWKRIHKLLQEGFTKTELAKRLGHGVAIQFGKKRVTARSDFDVARFYDQVMN